MRNRYALYMTMTTRRTLFARRKGRQALLFCSLHLLYLSVFCVRPYGGRSCTAWRGQSGLQECQRKQALLATSLPCTARSAQLPLSRVLPRAEGAHARGACAKHSGFSPARERRRCCARVSLWSEWTLLQTGCGLPPGPGGSLGALEGVSYLLLVGVFGASVQRKVNTGTGLPAGPGGALGAVEGVTFLAVLAGVVVAGLTIVNSGALPSALPDARCFGN